MSSKLLQNLLLTFLLSLLLTGFLYAVWFNLKPRGFEEGQAMTLLFVVGDIFQNIILTLSALPVFFLTKGKLFNNTQTRLLLYFAAPILLTLIFILFVGNSWEDKIGFLLPGLSFITVHLYFYIKLIRFKQENNS